MSISENSKNVKRSYSWVRKNESNWHQSMEVVKLLSKIVQCKANIYYKLGINIKFPFKMLLRTKIDQSFMPQSVF